MSRQVNFFAHPADADRLHVWLLGEFPGLKVITGDVGTLEEMEPKPAADALAGEGLMFLIPVWASDQIIIEPLEQWGRTKHDSGEQSILRRSVSPVIEYSPSVWDEPRSSLAVGRLYWQYAGEITADARRQLDRMFRWVRKETVPVPPHNTFRIFPQAVRHAHWLLNGVGAARPNPLREETEEVAEG